MVCEEPTCAYRTRVITRLNKNFDPLCPSCSNKNILLREVRISILIWSNSNAYFSKFNFMIYIFQYTEAQLYNQLCFFQHLFDITSIISKYKLPLKHDMLIHKNYCKLKAQVDEFLQYSAYNIIDLGKICRQMLMK